MSQNTSAIKQITLPGEQGARDAVELFIECLRSFKSHPAGVGENYWQHGWFTVTMGARLILTALALMLHGIFPFLCTTTATEQVEKIYNVFRARKEKGFVDDFVI